MKKINNQEGLVTVNTFCTNRKRDNKLVGIKNVRHELNDYLFKYRKNRWDSTETIYFSKKCDK